MRIEEATASGSDAAWLRTRGIDRVIDYRSKRFEAVLGAPVDVVLDVLGAETQARSWAVVANGGRMVSTLGPTEPLLETAGHGVRQMRSFGTVPDGRRLVEVARQIDAGTIIVRPSQAMSLADTAEALDRPARARSLRRQDRPFNRRTPMRIGIIGAGNVGQAIGKRLAARGHEVMISFARDFEKVKATAQRIGAAAGTPEEAAAHGEVVVLATPWGVTLDVVRSVAGALAGKPVWDTTNPLKPDMSGLELGTTTSGGEEVAKAALGALIVKAVPPMAEKLAADGALLIEGRAPGVFVCGDDAEARASVLRLVGDIGADGVDAGPLANARYTEPLGMLLVQLAYVQGMGANIGSSLLREAKA